MKYYRFFFILSLSFLNFIKSEAQIPTVQDCLGAIPVCQDTFIQPNSFTGFGNIPNELVPPFTCIANEINAVWYTFTVQVSGILDFSITPIDPSNDYDWAIFDLTNHVCSEITNLPLQVACNFAGNNGGAGVTGTIGGTVQQTSPSFPVTAGNRYVMVVSNYSATQQSGYMLDFTAATAQIYDNIPPVMDSTNTSLSCGEDSLLIYFSENIYCNSIQATDFSLTGPGGPYTINAVSSTSCDLGGDYGSVFKLSFSPAINVGGLFTLSLQDTVYDLCYNAPLLPTNFQFTVVSVALNTTQTDVSCFGQSNGSANVLPAGNFTYSWNTVPIQTTQSATGLSAGNYTVTVTPPTGCPTQANITITEPLALAQTSIIQNASNCGSSNGSASITITGGTAPYTYLWAPSGGTSSTASTLTGGNYTVTVTDQKGCTLVLPVSIPFDGMTAGISASQDVACFGEQTGSAAVSVTLGSGTYSYQWYDSGFNPIAGATGALVNNLTAGNYQVIVTDIQGCKDTVPVTINQPATALTAVLSSVSTSCGGNNGSATFVPSGGTPPYFFHWSTAATTSSITGLAAGVYTATVTDSNGCIISANDSVKSSAIPLVNLGGIQDVTCFGGNDGAASVNPSGGVPPFTVNWSNGSTTNSVNNFTAGIYVVTVTDITGCTTTESFTINQASQLVLNSSTGTIICISDSANIAVVANGGNPPYTYLWSTGNTANGISVSPVISTSYTVTVTDSMGCPSGISTIQVTVLPPLGISLVSDTSICRGQTITLTAVGTGGNGVYSYQWNNNTAIGQSISVSPSQDTTYTVTVTDNCGTPADSTSASVHLIEAPVVNFSYNPDAGCEPLTVSFTDSSQTLPNSVWLWNFGDGNTSNSLNPVHTYTQSGLFDVALTVTNAFGCSKDTIKNKIIDVFKKPVPTVEYDPKNPTLYNPTVQFSDRSPGATIWSWDFGDNTPGSAEQNPIHTYKDTGLYIVKLVVSNLQQCTDSIEIIVHVQDEYSFYIPSAFTPNGNGMNDDLNVYGVGLSHFDVSLFNRWGMLVAKTKDVNPVWDGSLNGSPAEEGVYVYVIDLIERDGRKHRVKGYVTLIR